MNLLPETILNLDGDTRRCGGRFFEANVDHGRFVGGSDLVTPGSAHSDRGLKGLKRWQERVTRSPDITAAIKHRQNTIGIGRAQGAGHDHQAIRHRRYEPHSDAGGVFGQAVAQFHAKSGAVARRLNFIE